MVQTMLVGDRVTGMRLSATDRIIREAEGHDDAAVEVAEHPDTEKVSAAPFVALGIPAPRMPTPLSGGVDIDLDGDDGGHDEEGETQVDAQRSAAALQEMRALQTQLAPPPALTLRSDTPRQRRIPPGRPAGAAPATGAPAPSPSTTLIFGSATTAPALSTPAPALRMPPLAGPPADVERDVERFGHLFSPARPPFGAIPLPAAAAPARRTGRVSRRTGVAIAASTALAVALIAGAWTAKKSPTPAESALIPGPPPVLPSSLRPGANAPTPPRPNGPVVVATPPTPTPSEPAAERPPAAEEVVPPAALIEAAPAPLTAPTPAAAPAKRAQAAAAGSSKKAAAKARLAKKRTALAAAAAKRKARAHKTGRAVASAGDGGSAPSVVAAPSRTTAGRAHGDPDDTLPITD